MLYEYLQQTQRFLGDITQGVYNPADLIYYINSARRQIALEGQCVRFVPDRKLNATVLYQEDYLFSSIDLTGILGVAQVVNVKSITVVWGTYQYTLLKNSWSKHQALVRTYVSTTSASVILWKNDSDVILPWENDEGDEVGWSGPEITIPGFSNVPSYYAQLGQGVQGSYWLYPVPNGAYPLEIDCLGIPSDLLLESDYEAIPYPWTDCVPYFAAYLALSGASAQAATAEMATLRMAQADRYFKTFLLFMKRARAFSQSSAVANWYGRGV